MGQFERLGAGLKKNLGQGGSAGEAVGGWSWGVLGRSGGVVGRTRFFWFLRPGSDFIVIIAQIGIYESWDVWRGWGKLRGWERASTKIGTIECEQLFCGERGWAHVVHGEALPKRRVRNVG